MGVNAKELAAGLIFSAIGIFFALSAWLTLPIGEAFSMGPGYFPVLLSAAIVLVGAAVALRSLVIDGPPIEPFAWRPVLFVLASILIFAFLISLAGLVVTTALLAIVAAYARPHARLVESLLLAIALAVFAVVLFVYALGQPMPIWWWS